MRRILPALTAALLLLPATAAPATSFFRELPHDPKEACAAIGRLVADLGAGRLKGADESFARTAFHSDSFGKVEKEEEQAFLHAMTHSEGKADSRPVRLHHVYSVSRDKRQPVYLVALQRLAWHETSLRSNDDMNELSVERVVDPHYGVDTTYWLATFEADRIHHFREAPEMYVLLSGSRQLKNCPR